MGITQRPPSIVGEMPGHGGGDVPLSIIFRAVTADTTRDHPSTINVIELGVVRRYAIIVLILLCNLTQYMSMFSTVAGGFELSARLNHDSGPGEANWMGAAFSLTQSAFVLISGQLGAVYGHRNLVILGGSIVSVCSLGNAFCTTYASFVAARAVTGIGGGILMPNAVACLTLMSPPGTARNFTLAAFAASPPVGAMIGALSIGLALEYSEWKWHFIAIAALTFAFFGMLFIVFPHEDPMDKDGVVDYIGATLGVIGLILFNFAWNQATTVGWGSPYLIAILILSLLCMGCFFVWEHRWAKEPIMPISLFKSPSFKPLILVVVLIYMSVGISLWYMVAWQQLIRGWSVLHVAVGWVPYGIGASLAVVVAAYMIPRMEAQYILAIGCLTSMITMILLASMPEQQSYWAQIFPATIIGSLCPDFVYVAAQVIASDSVGRRDQGVAGSLIGTLNLYGNGLGLGFAGLVDNQVSKHLHSQVAGFRAALWFGFGLALAGLTVDLFLVRMPKDVNNSTTLETSTE